MNTRLPAREKLISDTEFVQAVDRALTILSLIADHGVPVSINDLATELGMNRTTVWRLLATMERRDFVERDASTKGFRLGYALMQLAAQSDQNSSLARRARPMMEYLCQTSQETVLLSVPKHSGILTIDQVDPAQSVRLVNYVNTILPLHCTSNGKMFLALLDEQERSFFLDQPIDPCTPNSIVSTSRIRQELIDAREGGYAMSIGELDTSENGVSVPVFDRANRPLAFLSVAGPSFRFTKEVALELLPEVQRTAEGIGKALMK